MPAAPSNGRANRVSTSKNALLSLVVTFKLSPKLLQQFPTDTPEQSVTNEVLADKSAERSSPASSTEVTVVRPSSADNASDADATSTPATGATPGDTPRRKGVPGPKPGNKRTNGQIEPTGRARGRPGPKKKPKTYVFSPRVSPSTVCNPANQAIFYLTVKRAPTQQSFLLPTVSAPRPTPAL